MCILFSAKEYNEEIEKSSMSETTNIPRLLIISVNALRKGGSNGKVLTEMLGCWPSDKIAQFFMHDEQPDFDVCQNFFRVTDREALLAFKTGKRQYHILTKAEKIQNNPDQNGNAGKPNKNALTLLLRDIVWNSKRWQGKEFWQWIEDFNPDVVLLQAGASSYTHNIAVQVSRKYSIPLAIFNTENYYLKNYNYLEGRGWDFVYPIYKWECDRAFRKLMKQSSLEIYTNELLDEQYYKVFHRHGVLVYQGSTLDVMPCINNKPPRFTYAGNLGVNRHVPLIEVAQALQRLSPDYYLDVYGKTPNDVIKSQLEKEPGIRYHGIVPYSEVIRITEESDFMVHAESSDPFWIRDLNAAFSTKISDILKAGKCLILYADASFACSKFVERNDCGCLITKRELLEAKIKELVSSQELQEKYCKNAIQTAERDLDSKKNSEKFLRTIASIIR